MAPRGEGGEGCQGVVVDEEVDKEANHKVDEDVAKVEKGGGLTRIQSMEVGGSQERRGVSDILFMFDRSQSLF